MRSPGSECDDAVQFSRGIVFNEGRRFLRCQRGEVEISLVSKMESGQLENEADVEACKHVMTVGVKSACFTGRPCFKPIVQTGNEPARISAG
jgi:hypothetical protein